MTTQLVSLRRSDSNRLRKNTKLPVAIIEDATGHPDAALKDDTSDSTGQEVVAKTSTKDNPSNDSTMAGKLAPSQSKSPEKKVKVKAKGKGKAKERHRPESLAIRLNMPFEKRLNPHITPDDPEFVKMVQYFAKLLRDLNMTIDQILKENFTAHEIQKFTPTNEWPMSKVQQNNIEDFQNLLDGQFNGTLPTLEVKMAIMYFGLPVAPMKMPMYRELNPEELKDFSDFEEDKPIERHPLEFLNYWSRRTYGEQPSVTEDHIYGLRLASNNQVMGLRGGGLTDDELEDVLSEIEEESSTQWQDQVDNQLTLTLRGGGALDGSHRGNAGSQQIPQRGILIQSRQGYRYVWSTWGNIENAISDLLSLNTGDNIEVCVDKFQGNSLVGTSLRTFFQPSEDHNDDANDGIKKYIYENVVFNTPLGDTKANSAKLPDALPTISCFVRLASDHVSSTPRPMASRKTGLSLLSHQGPTGSHAVGYVRTPIERFEYKPASKLIVRSPAQWTVEFQRFRKALFPGEPHQFISFRMCHRGVTDFHGKVYSCQDPQRLLIDRLSKDDSLVEMNVEAIKPNVVPVIIPDHEDQERDYTIQPRPMLTLEKKDLIDVCALCNLVESYCQQSFGSVKEEIGSMEVWIPAQGYQDLQVSPTVVPFHSGCLTTSGNTAFQKMMNEFKDEHAEHYTRGFALVARPVFDLYRFKRTCPINDDQHVEFSVKLMELDLEIFKDVLTRSMCADYDKRNKNHVAHINFGGTPIGYHHCIRSDTTEDDWQRILRRVPSSHVEVRFTFDEETARQTDLDLDLSSYWGPCYDGASVANIPKKVPAAKENPVVKVRPAGVTKDEFKKRSWREPKKSAAGNKQTPISTVNPPQESAKKQKVDQLFHKSSNNILGAINHVAMRSQAYWDSPSIFSNPLKPVMPLHAPPIESIIKTGPSMPGVSLAMRTPTEMARLQREVHMLRGQIMDRVRECPYQGCNQYFHFRDSIGLDRHLHQDHAVLKCFLCPRSEDPKLRFFDQEQIKKHFIEAHYDNFEALADDTLAKKAQSMKLSSQIKAPFGEKKRQALFNFCDRCGRDQRRCDQLEDHLDHQHRCRSHDGNGLYMFEDKQTHCATCGHDSPRGAPACLNDTCPTRNNQKPQDNFCSICGLHWNNRFSEAYKAIHNDGCSPMGGKTWDYCGFCGTELYDQDDKAKREHNWWCQERPRPKAIVCPDHPEVTLRTPEDCLQHSMDWKYKDHVNNEFSCLFKSCAKVFVVDGVNWLTEKKLKHYAKHLRQIAPLSIEKSYVEPDDTGERCRHYDQCGVITTNMSQWQKEAHMDKHLPDLTPYLPNGQPNHAVDHLPEQTVSVWAAPGDHTQSPRAASPDWSSLSPESDRYMPREDMRCSRCFRPAGSEDDVRIHSDPNLSCRIRRAPGKAPWDNKAYFLPNRSGWIKFPAKVDPAQVRARFLQWYPAYVYTMFPVDPKRVKDVYGEQPNKGTLQDDPNAIYRPGSPNWSYLSRSYGLPWPPVSGHVIPHPVEDAHSKNIIPPPPAITGRTVPQPDTDVVMANEHAPIPTPACPRKTQRMSPSSQKPAPMPTKIKPRKSMAARKPKKNKLKISKPASGDDSTDDSTDGSTDDSKDAVSEVAWPKSKKGYRCYKGEQVKDDKYEPGSSDSSTNLEDNVAKEESSGSETDPDAPVGSGIMRKKRRIDAGKLTYRPGDVDEQDVYEEQPNADIDRETMAELLNLPFEEHPDPQLRSKKPISPTKAMHTGGKKSPTGKSKEPTPAPEKPKPTFIDFIEEPEPGPLVVVKEPEEGKPKKPTVKKRTLLKKGAVRMIDTAAATVSGDEKARQYPYGPAKVSRKASVSSSTNHKTPVSATESAVSATGTTTRANKAVMADESEESEARKGRGRKRKAAGGDEELGESVPRKVAKTPGALRRGLPARK